MRAQHIGLHAVPRHSLAYECVCKRGLAHTCLTRNNNEAFTLVHSVCQVGHGAAVSMAREEENASQE